MRFPYWNRGTVSLNSPPIILADSGQVIHGVIQREGMFRVVTFNKEIYALMGIVPTQALVFLP
jgi:hypothetical protein